MGTPTLTLLNSTSINTAESVTGWTTFDTLDPDIVKEGSNGITGTFRSDGTEGDYNAGSAPVTAVGKTFRMWINTTNVAYMDTAANGGYELSMHDGTTTEYKTVFSSDDYFGGWFNIVYDCDAFTTLTLANVEQWGLRVQHHTSAKNVDNVWVDALKYLDGYSMTGGTALDPITLSDIEIADRGTTTLYGYGVITEFGGVYYATGDIQFGTGATTMYFEMDGDILVFEDKPVASGLYSLSGVGAGSTVTIKNNSTITSAGTTDSTRYAFDWSDANLASFSCTDSLIVRAAACTFKSGQTVTGNTFNDCDQITHAGSDMDDCIVKDYEGTANTSALIYNVNSDPNTTTAGMTFDKGTAATHAIEFGLLSPLTMNLSNCTFTDYNASDTQNDSTFHFKRTSGTVTLNLSGCTGNFSYRSDGATIVISSDITVTFSNMKDNSEVRIYENISVEDTDISFTATNTISSAGSGFGSFAADDIVRISGSDDNDDTYTVVTASASTLTVTPATITTESAGATVKIKKINQTELAGIEDATAGSPDERTFAASIASGTLVDYVIHNFQPGDEVYQTIRVIDFTWPSSVQTIVINQQIDRNVEN